MRIQVEVKASANKNRLQKIAENRYFAQVRAPARKGLANQALLELLEKKFTVPANSLRIIRGLRSPRKLVEIK